MTAPDCRSICLIVEPIFNAPNPGPEVTWRAMGFVGGKTVSHITGSDRSVVIDDTLCAIAAAGVSFDFDETDARSVSDNPKEGT